MSNTFLNHTHMQVRNLLIGSVIATTALASLGTVSASFIGSGTVASSGALTVNINWSDTFPGTASGTINGIVIK